MINFFKPTILASVVSPVLALPSFAQPLTWWDILSPDRLIESITRYAVVLARTQVDLTFEDISTNLLSNRTTISNLRIWPALPWHDGEICQVSFERATISGQVFDDLDNVKVRIDAYEAMVTPGCFPSEARTEMARLGLEDVRLPSININVGYHIPSSRANVSLLASVSDVVEASIATEFDYVALRGPRGRGDPQPIAFLSKASLELHNLGGWEALSQFLPPALTDEETASAAIDSVLRTALSDMNRESLNSESDELSILQLAFISSATAAWTEFLKSPDQIVLETNIAPDRPVFLNFWEYDDNPSAIIRDLNPIMRAAMSHTPKVLSEGEIKSLLTGAWRDLPAVERLDIGIALARGDGVPRNRLLASEILTQIAEDGNSDAAAAIAEALEPTDSETAYYWSLRAGASGVNGTTSRLDRLEAELPLQTILRIQNQASEAPQENTVLPSSIVGIRARARDHLTGIGAPRNYQIAHTWASVGAALRDPASVAIIEEVSKTLDAGKDAAAKSAAEKLRRISSNAALELWSKLIPVLDTPEQSTGTTNGRRSDQPAHEAEDVAVVSDNELQTCIQIFATKLPDDYQVGGSCVSNNAVLLRELALATRDQDALRSRLAEKPSVEIAPDVALPEREPSGDQLEAEMAESAAVEAAAVAENEILRQELAAATAELAEGERKVAVLNTQISELRAQLTSLQSLIDETSHQDQETQVRIETLGAQLNAALARVAAEERQRYKLEKAQRERLEQEARRLAEDAARPPSDAETLGQFRARFIQGLGDVLANRADVIVVDDRLVFSSRALFQPGSTTLSASGRAQIAEIMGRFTETAVQIPTSVDWIVRVDGHTDDIPISSSAFVDNWDLSQARALSVVRYLTDELAFPPHRLAAVGFGEFRPLNSESTAAARAQNRRIELLLTTR